MKKLILFLLPISCFFFFTSFNQIKTDTEAQTSITSSQTSEPNTLSEKIASASMAKTLFTKIQTALKTSAEFATNKPKTTLAAAALTTGILIATLHCLGFNGAENFINRMFKNLTGKIMHWTAAGATTIATGVTAGLEKEILENEKLKATIVHTVAEAVAQVEATKLRTKIAILFHDPLLAAQYFCVTVIPTVMATISPFLLKYWEFRLNPSKR